MTLTACSRPCDDTAIHKNVQCHSLAVGDVITLHFTKMCNVTHNLFKVIGKDVMRLPFTKCAMSPTLCWSQEKDVIRLPFTQMYNVAHNLLIIGKEVS